MGWKWAWRLLCISSISTSTSTQTGHTYILLKGNHMSPFLLLLPWSRPSHYPLLTSIQRCAATQLSYNKNNKTLICAACRFPLCKFSHYGLFQATDSLAIMSWQNSWICNHQLPCTIVSWLKPTTDSTHYSMHRSPVITLLKNLEKLPSTWALSAKSLAEFPVPCTPRHRPPLQSHVVPPFNYTPAYFFLSVPLPYHDPSLVIGPLNMCFPVLFILTTSASPGISVNTHCPGKRWTLWPRRVFLTDTPTALLTSQSSSKSIRMNRWITIYPQNYMLSEDRSHGSETITLFPGPRQRP